MFLSRPGFSLHYEIREGALPHDTIFLHGNLGSNLWWEPSLKELPGGNGRAILAEWRGCGKSREFSDFNLSLLADDVNALAAAISTRAVDIVGHSTGGLIALHAIAKARHRYRRAVLLAPVSPGGIAFTPEKRRAYERMKTDRAFCRSVILGTIRGGNLSEEFREQIVDAAFSVNSELFTLVPEMIEHPPTLDLSLIDLPVLVAHGEFDLVLPMEESRKLALELSSGEFKMLPGRGHCANLEDPLGFANITHRFAATAKPCVKL